ncbi:MAG: bifunctional pyr operon transcriptional regulator/uracil phosphoribosyltransferase PyrR [Firmicutes bacterium]|nr:bifunctional pyr operon transcriptional regulator/uracil phosphoribosyltransferase PyrR [Bacillota bacterium]
MTEILDAAQMHRALTRIAHEIAERNQGVENVVLIGIERRGPILAKRLASVLSALEGEVVPAFSLDVSPFRDDQRTNGAAPRPPLDLPVDGKRVVLVDDVLFTGRTVRAAIEALFDCGRPQSVQLAILVDRGHRELPIRPDFVGKNVPTSHQEYVAVRIAEIDGQDGVYLGHQAEKEKEVAHDRS